MTDRRPPPPRRPNETRKLVWKGQSVFVTIGYAQDHLWAPPVRTSNAPPDRLPPAADRLSPCEIFYDSGYKSGSDMEILVSDLCIALSVMLQQKGVTAESLARSMSQRFDHVTGQPEPGSILGLLLSEIARPPAWSAELAKAPDQDAGTGQGEDP